ncbi:MAG: NUDIX hydrolase [bacterium]
MNYCSHCGEKVKFGAVPGDDMPRFYCENCQTIHYQNPKIIVGCIPRWQDKVLLCKRAIEPRKGLWTLPSGFLENGENVEQGAMRETREEANAEVQIIRLFAVYSLPQLGQIYLQFLSDLINLDYHPGMESEEVKLFSKEDIPWEQIAFSAIKFTLDKYFNEASNPRAEVYLGTARKRK